MKKCWDPGSGSGIKDPRSATLLAVLSKGIMALFAAVKTLTRVSVFAVISCALRNLTVRELSYDNLFIFY
jgi:hypothetical protein